MIWDYYDGGLKMPGNKKPLLSPTDDGTPWKTVSTSFRYENKPYHQLGTVILHCTQQYQHHLSASITRVLIRMINPFSPCKNGDFERPDTYQEKRETAEGEKKQSP